MDKIEYQLIKSNRKSISIKIVESGKVIVRAPNYATDKQIQDVIENKKEWIKESINKMKVHFQQKEKFIFDYNSKIMVFGEEYDILTIDGNTAKFNENEKCFYFPKDLSSDDLKATTIVLLKKIAKLHINKRVIHYSNIMKVMPRKLKITSAKTRWGSCSGKNNINFSWRLIMGDKKLIDYVVVHELAHTIEHNHSESFWKIVEHYLPDYKESEAGLKKLGRKLSLEKWD